MSDFWVMLIIIVLNLAMVVAFSLALTAVTRVCDVELDTQLKAGMIVMEVVMSLIPYLNMLTLVFWFIATFICIGIYFDSV